MVDEGFAKTMNTSTLRDDIYAFYAFAFGQKGIDGQARPGGLQDLQDTPQT